MWERRTGSVLVLDDQQLLTGPSLVNWLRRAAVLKGFSRTLFLTHRDRLEIDPRQKLRVPHSVDWELEGSLSVFPNEEPRHPAVGALSSTSHRLGTNGI